MFILQNGRPCSLPSIPQKVSAYFFARYHYIWLSSGLKEKIKCRDPVCKHNLPLHCSIRQTTGLEVRKGTLVVLKGQTCCRVIVIEACKLTFCKFLRFLDCCWTVFLIGSFNRFLIISSTNYFSSGINKWRDSRTPKQILEKYCEVNNFFKPRYLGNNNVIFHGDEFYLDDFGKLISTVTSVFFLSFFLSCRVTDVSATQRSRVFSRVSRACPAQHSSSVP